MDSRIWWMLVVYLACTCVCVSAQDGANTTSTTPISNNTSNETSTASSNTTLNEMTTASSNATTNETTTASSNDAANETTTASSNTTSNETTTGSSNTTFANNGTQTETNTMPPANTTVPSNSTATASNTTSNETTTEPAGQGDNTTVIPSNITTSTETPGVTNTTMENATSSDNTTLPSSNMTTSTETPGVTNTTMQNATSSDNTTSAGVDNSTTSTQPTVPGNDTSTSNSTETNSTVTASPTLPGDNTTNTTDTDTTMTVPSTSPVVVTSPMPPMQELYPPGEINTGALYTLTIPFAIGNSSNETTIAKDITEQFKNVPGFSKVLVKQKSSSRRKRAVDDFPLTAELLFDADEVNKADIAGLTSQLESVLRTDLADIMLIDSNFNITSTVVTFVETTRSLCKAEKICDDAYTCSPATPSPTCLHKCTTITCDAEHPCEVAIFRNKTIAPQCRFKAEEMPEKLPNWTYIVPSVIGGLLLIILIVMCFKANRSRNGHGNDNTKYSMNPMFASS